MSVTSTFHRVATKAEIMKGLARQERPIISVEATNYVGVPIAVAVGIKIAGVYVASNLETIRLRVTYTVSFLDKMLLLQRKAYSPEILKLSPSKMKTRTMLPNRFGDINIYHPQRMIYISRENGGARTLALERGSAF